MSTTLHQWRADFQRQFALARAGDDDAAARFVARYGKHFLRVVRSHLHARLHTVLDPEDVMQDFYLSVFTGRQLEDIWLPPEKLVAYLKKTARNLALQVNRKQLQAAKRSLHREEHVAGGAFAAIEQG